MDKFQLAILARWAGQVGLQGRKRLQKTVFLLQSAGCPLDADFILHHYGPYSRDVADVCDEMAAEKLLLEETDETAGVPQYNYKIPAHTVSLLEQTIAAAPQRQNAIKPYEDLAKKLLARDVWSLELGSTILFFYSKSKAWEEAIKQACDFKKVKTDSPTVTSAVALAREIEGFKAVA